MHLFSFPALATSPIPLYPTPTTPPLPQPSIVVVVVLYNDVYVQLKPIVDKEMRSARTVHAVAQYTDVVCCQVYRSIRSLLFL